MLWPSHTATTKSNFSFVWHTVHTHTAVTNHNTHFKINQKQALAGLLHCILCAAKAIRKDLWHQSYITSTVKHCQWKHCHQLIHKHTSKNVTLPACHSCCNFITRIESPSPETIPQRSAAECNQTCSSALYRLSYLCQNHEWQSRHVYCNKFSWRHNTRFSNPVSICNIFMPTIWNTCNAQNIPRCHQVVSELCNSNRFFTHSFVLKCANRYR